MEDKIVLICATGRSGSTTMQRIINTIPGSNICGENYGAVNSLLDFYNKLHATSSDYVPGHYNPASYEEIVSKNVKPAWYNSYKIKEMEDQIRKLIITMFKNKPETNLWGFKEIRYDNKKIHLIKLFKTLFPQTKVIIQIRENIQAQSKSGWHKDDKNAPAYIQQMNKELIEFSNQNRDWCHLISFERMFVRSNLQNLFSFIDCREKYDENKVTEVLNNNIKD
jgi:hypothetical protein